VRGDNQPPNPSGPPGLRVLARRIGSPGRMAGSLPPLTAAPKCWVRYMAYGEPWVYGLAYSADPLERSLSPRAP
jgi:hypothetical protein